MKKKFKFDNLKIVIQEWIFYLLVIWHIQDSKTKPEFVQCCWDTAKIIVGGIQRTKVFQISQS